MLRGTRTHPIGTFEGTSGDRTGYAETRIDVSVGEPRVDDESGEWFVDVEITARFRAKPDQTTRVELPAFAAETLQERLGAVVEAARE